MTATACPPDEELIGYTDAGLGRECRDRVEKHLDACSRCLTLVGGLARSSNAGLAPWSGPPPARLLAEGDVLANRYLVRRMLGAGAMGEVYEAEDRLLGKTIALKTLNAIVAADANALARLRSEVALAHRVTHPNVCRIHDLGVDADRAGEPLRFLTMEYLDGRTLSTYLREEGPPSPECAFSILAQLASALAAAHSVGVIHRDLKGDNVMLVKHGSGQLRAVVTDFGLAGPVPTAELRSPAERLAYSSAHAHVAPEQLAGRGANPTTDVYSFGLLAYHVLTGKSPTAVNSGLDRFDEKSALAQIARVDLAASLRWQSFLRQALHPDASRRIPDGSSLETALRATAPRTIPSSRRAWAYGGFAVAVGLAVTLVGWTRRDPEPPPLAVRPPPVIAPIAAEKQAARPLAPPLTTAVLAAPPPRVSRRRDARDVLRAQLDTHAVAGREATIATVGAHTAAGGSEEIVRDLPSRVRPVASESDLADPFAPRGAHPQGDDR